MKQNKHLADKVKNRKYSQWWLSMKPFGLKIGITSYLSWNPKFGEMIGVCTQKSNERFRAKLDIRKEVDDGSSW